MFLFFLFARGVAAQTAYEWWPELDIFWRPAQPQRTFLELSSQSERESPKNQATIGLYQDWMVLPNGGFLRGGYRYTRSTHDASYRESRLVAEAVMAAHTLYETQFANRARVEWRWVNGEPSYRIRERVRLLRATRGIRGQPMSPYITFEAYYDSKYNAISRLAGRVGAELPFSKRRRLDVYWARQDNSRGSPPRLQALGMTLSLTY